MNYSKISTFCFIFISSILSTQTLLAQSGISDVETKVYIEERKALQSRFAVAQAKLDLKSEASKAEARALQGGFGVEKSGSSAEAQLKMEEVNKEIESLAKRVLAYELNRYSVWNSQSFWIVTLKSGKTTSFWSAGPSAKYVVQKLDDQIQKLKELKVAIAGPFKKSDLNDTQKMLDAMRAALDLDIELTRMAKQYLGR